ncbi:MAG: AraC family transcriptional regulator [Saprospiraceae bacterium]
MKVYQEITPVTGADIFVILDSVNKGFEYPIHNHAEFELTLVMGSAGTRIMGDSVLHYADEDLVLIGPYLFHKWDDEEKKGDQHNPCRVVTIQFDMHLFDKYFLSKKPFVLIQALLRTSGRGIRFFGKTREEAKSRIEKLTGLSGLESVTEFLLLLDLLSKSSESEFLANTGFNVNLVQSNSKRLNAAYQYIIAHFQESTLKMSNVAAEVNLGDSAFSHFFKKATNRSFSDYLIAMRIEYACKLLLESDEQISRIAFLSGFNNIANFNRMFKKAHHATPIRFRKIYQEKNKFDWNRQITPGQFIPAGVNGKNGDKPLEYSTRYVRS